MKKIFVKSIFVCLFVLITSFAFCADTDEFNLNYVLNDKSFLVDAEVEYNYWFPNECYFLNYETKGIPLLKLDAKATIDGWPEFHVKWETNLQKSETDDILAAHKENDGLKDAYNKLQLITSFGRRVGSLAHYNPWRNNRNCELTFTRETFRIGVKPNMSNIYFIDTDGEIYDMERSEKLVMYTKFDELGLTFNTHGILMLPAFFRLLFVSNSEDVNIRETTMETSLGGYFSTWQKPYSVEQIITSGFTSGYDNVVYAARFFSLGLTEKSCYAGKIFYFKNKFNMGIAWVKLTDDQELFDTTSPIFMQFNIAPEMGFHIPIVKEHLYLNILGSVDWGCMMGVNVNPDDSDGSSPLMFTGFINSDAIVRGNLSLTAMF